MDLSTWPSPRKIDQHQAEHAPLVAAIKAFANELPQLLQPWRTSELPKQPDATTWQVLEAVSYDAERSYLKVSSERHHRA